LTSRQQLAIFPTSTPVVVGPAHKEGGGGFWPARESRLLTHWNISLISFVRWSGGEEGGEKIRPSRESYESCLHRIWGRNPGQHVHKKRSNYSIYITFTRQVVKSVCSLAHSSTLVTQAREHKVGRYGDTSGVDDARESTSTHMRTHSDGGGGVPPGHLIRNKSNHPPLAPCEQTQCFHSA